MTARLEEKPKDCKFFHCPNEKSRLKIPAEVKKISKIRSFFSSRQKKTKSRKIIVLLKEKRL